MKKRNALTEPIHSINHRVIYGDTDAAGVVYNANYLRYFEIGRTEFMREQVCSYREIEEKGIILPVTECYSRYKAPAFYDDLITIESSLTELRRFSFRFDYRISRANETKHKPTLLVRGYTIHAAITRDGKLTPLPADLLEKIRPLL